MGWRQAAVALRRHWRPALVLGTLNAAIPFWLVAWGEKHIDSSVAGVAQATVAIFTFLLAARFLPHEPVGLTRIVGVAVGFLGVAVLAGFDPGGGWLALVGTLAVVLSSLSYAASRRLRTAPRANGARARARDGLDARRRSHPAAACALPAPGACSGRRSDRRAAHADPARNGVRAADPVPACSGCSAREGSPWSRT